MLKVILVWVIVFFVFVSVYWVMLLLIVWEFFNGGFEFYGMLLGFVGGGVVFGVLFLFKICKKLGVNIMVVVGMLGMVVVFVVFVLVLLVVVVVVVFLFVGFFWIVVLFSLNIFV